MVGKPIKPMPTRMSAPKPEDRKPSKIIAAFWWVVFIVPVIFVYLTTESWLFVAILIAIRIGMMFIPWMRHGGEQKKEPEQKVAIKVPQTVNSSLSILTPYKEEAIAEWWGFLKFMRIYDKEKEEANLITYRRLRGWE